MDNVIPNGSEGISFSVLISALIEENDKQRT